jgi:hypothetical protein
LAAGLERGGTRRNPRALFLDALSNLGAELRVDAGRQGLVLSLDVAAEHGADALARLAELSLERSPSSEGATASEWLASRLGANEAATRGRASLDEAVPARLAALDRARVSDAPWSPREWSERIGSLRWDSVEDRDLASIAREAFRGGAMTLLIVGDLPVEQARAFTMSRWSALPRGAGLPVQPLGSPRAAGPGRYVDMASETASHVWVFERPASPGDHAALALLARTIDRCKSSNLEYYSAFYPDPARPALALSIPLDGAPVASIRALRDEPARLIESACFAEQHPHVRASLLRELQPWDGRAWADARAWAVHDGRSSDEVLAMVRAVAGGSVESVRASLRGLLSSARGQWGVSGPRDRIGSLCARAGVASLEEPGGALLECPVGPAVTPAPR